MCDILLLLEMFTLLDSVGVGISILLALHLGVPILPLSLWDQLRREGTRDLLVDPLETLRVGEGVLVVRWSIRVSTSGSVR